VIPVEMNTFHDGLQMVYKFDNGYGASVIQHAGSYGGKSSLWELAVLDMFGVLCYDTDITSDVIGYLSWPEVEKKLIEINRLHID